MNNNIRRITRRNYVFSFVLLLTFIVVVASFHIYIAIVMSVLSAIVIYLEWLENQRRTNDVISYVEKLDDTLRIVNQATVLDMPIPFVITNLSDEIIWYNKSMINVLDYERPMNAHITDAIVGISLEKLTTGVQKELKIGDKFFDVHYKAITTPKSTQAIYKSFYFVDRTEFKKLKELHHDQSLVIANIQLDNYDDLLNEIKEDKRPFLTSEIDKKISLMATRSNGLLKKYEKDKYIMVFEHKHLDNMMSNKFLILDEIREIDIGNHISPTLSIGVSAIGGSPSRIEENSFAALELGLGRGGDQAVVKTEHDFEFYGGRTKAVEKRNRVKARIVAHAFRPILDESDNVYIMGHQFPDMDAIGAAIGVFRAATNRGKEAHIVLEKPNDSIKMVYDKFKDDSEYRFISPEAAIKNFKPEKDLLVVVDTHKPSLTESPELLELAQRVVLIDHHRRGKEFIEDTLLTYLEPYASSACELVTEILQYMDKKLNITKKEAEALLAGIIVDTKNFSQQTGVRTFEAAALLRKHEADTIDVRQLFQDDIEVFLARAEMVKNAKIIRENIAMSISTHSVKNARLIAAQAADQLLNIAGIHTSFVVAVEGEQIYVSGRSLGEISVQLILEKIGGGGHMNVAGAQFDMNAFSFEDVENMIIDSIDEYLKKE